MPQASDQTWTPREARAQLVKAKKALGDLEAERKALLAVVKGFEGYLALHADDQEAPKAPDA